MADGVQRALGREPRDFSHYARDAAATGVWDSAAVAARGCETMVGILVALTSLTALGCCLSAWGFFAFSSFVIEGRGSRAMEPLRAGVDWQATTSRVAAT